jgi:hypothetical protein
VQDGGARTSASCAPASCSIESCLRYTLEGGRQYGPRGILACIPNLIMVARAVTADGYCCLLHACHTGAKDDCQLSLVAELF